MTSIVFSHGKESGPNGTKIKIMSEVAHSSGFKTTSIDYSRCKNANERVSLLKKHLGLYKEKNILLVGSSMGGYVSAVLANDCNLMGLFLLCPALYLQNKEYEIQDYLPKCKNIEVIHGWNDEIVPYNNSIKFGKITGATVNLINDNHRLNQSYTFIAKRFEYYLKEISTINNVYTK